MNDNMKEDVLRVLLSEDEIREKVRELGGKITADYKNSNLMLVTVLKGAVVFLDIYKCNVNIFIFNYYK